MIGVGSHGTQVNLMSYLSQEDAQIVALCDVDRNHLEHALNLVNRKYGNQDCAGYGDFRLFRNCIAEYGERRSAV